MNRPRNLLLAACALAFLPSPAGAAENRPPFPSPQEIARLPQDGGPDFNRLVFEKSPYLQSHARNPVDWRPWGDAAFEQARAENKPVFLSVGYSTCHWCHVMERESFEDAEVAALLNEHFIPVKVDREERPDLDAIYMNVTQAMTGGGGWPMTVFLTPEARPFFAGTYFPKAGVSGRPGMMDLLPNIAEIWKTRRDEVEKLGSEISASLAELGKGAPGEAPGLAELERAFIRMRATADPEHGGFGFAPKFPTPHKLMLLLRWHARTGGADALAIAEKALAAMRAGGIFDHVGLGFHRYTTDPEWLIPHFEKMLYDQALLAMAYAEAFQATRKAEYASAAREILDYVLRDMTSPEGAFYSAEDADSEGEEGKFYLWTMAELRAALPAEDAELFARVYGFEAEGNFLDPATGHKSGANIPHLKKPLSEHAKDLGLEEPALRERAEQIRAALFAAREKRIHPFKDDKILTDWNGLAIAAFAKAGAALAEPRYVEAARRAADFALAKLRTPEGLLVKRYRAGDAGLPAHLEDYAFLVWGLIELYEASFETRDLKAAIELTDLMLRNFADAERGGFFMTADGGEKLLMRPKEAYDGAIPSGNSVAALNLIRLARMTGRTEFERRAEETMKAFAGRLKENPEAHAMMLLAADFAAGPSHEIVIAGRRGAPDTNAMLAALGAQFAPRKVVLLKAEGEPELAAIAPYTENQGMLEGRAAAYVCRNFACEAPTADPAEMMKLLSAGKTAAAEVK